MKKALLFIVFLILVASVSGQKSINAIFKKYAGSEGFTTVTINGGLLKLVRLFDADNEFDDSLCSAISEIRILTQDDPTKKVENFYDLVIKDLDLDSYDEFMRVKETGQELRILVRTEGRRFREFLLVAGGEDNALIQIKGDLSLDEIRKLTDDARSDSRIDIVADHKK